MTTWTEVPASGAHRAWTAWDAEQADCGALVVLEYDPEWGKTWVASVLGPTVRDGIGATPEQALRMAGCDLPAPDVGTVALTGDPCNMRGMDKPADLVAAFARNDPGRQPDPEPDDRPVMAWWQTDNGCVYRDPVSSVQEFMAGPDPHPTALAKALGWRAVEVCGG